MEVAPFELAFTDGPTFALSRKVVGNLETRFAWSSLDPAIFPSGLIDRARIFWTKNALNEYRTAVVMGQLVQLWGEANVPLDLLAVAASFPPEELIHVEMCARLATQLGGGAPLPFAAGTLGLALDQSLTPRQKANEMAIVACCVGESVSLPLLAGSMKVAAHPLVREILKTIVQDEALHGCLGYWYLDWAADDFTPSERDRLGRIASATLREYLPLWESLRATPAPEAGRTHEGFEVRQLAELGSMEATAYTALAQRCVVSEVTEPLAKYGIVIDV